MRFSKYIFSIHKGGLRTDEGEGGASAMHFPTISSDSVVMTMVATAMVVPPEALSATVDEMRMHFKCRGCSTYAGATSTDVSCRDRCRDGQCKHVRTIYPRN